MSHEAEQAFGIARPVPRAWLGPCCVAAVFLAHAALFLNQPSVDGVRYAWHHLPLDDAWIYLSYARNLLRCGYITYNVGGAIENGGTSLLWILVLAPGLALLRNPVLTARVLGLGFGAGCVALTYVELRRAGGRVAAWSGALALACEPMWMMGCTSGMDAPMDAFLLMLMLRQIRRAQPWRLGLTFGLLLLARPETALPGAAALGLLGLARAVQQAPDAAWRARCRAAAAASARAGFMTFAVILPWALYCRLGTGHWLATPFYVKAGGHVVFSRETGAVIIGLISHFYFPSPLLHDPALWALLVAGAIGILLRARRTPAALAWIVLPAAHTLAWAGLLPMHVAPRAGEYLSFYYTRYLLPDYPFVLGLIGLGAGALAAGVARLGARLRTGLAPRPDRIARRALACAVVIILVLGNASGWWTIVGPLWRLGDGFVRSWPQTATYNTRACQNIFELQESAGRWIAAHLPPDATIAMEDAGGVRYFTRNPLIDLNGLQSQQYLFAADKRAFLLSHHVRYLAIFGEGLFDPLFDFKTRTLQRFRSMPSGISAGDDLEIREILGP